MKGTVTLVALGVLTARAAWPCHQPGNLVPSCGFDADLSGWVVSAGTWQWNAEAGPSGEAGSAEGGGRLAGSLDSSCFAASPNTTYAFGAAARAISQGSGTLCGVIATTFADSGCSTVDNFEFVVFPTPLPSEWTQVSAALRTSAAVVSAQLELFCASDPSVIARFDDAFFGEGLFPVELQGFSVE